MKKVAPFLFRGPRPKPQELIDNKIACAITLESGVYEDFHFDVYEDMPMNGPIKKIKIPCSDFTPPNAKQVQSFLTIVAQYTKLEERNVLVHCLTGKDRTGFMIAVYRMQVQSWTFEKAHAEWVELGRHIWYFWWKYKLKTWVKSPN